MPKEKLIQLLKEVIEEYDPRIYPQEEELEVKKALGKYLDVPPECIIMGNGSDPLIDLITRIFLGRGEGALSVTPTFPLYRHLVELQGAKYLGIPLKDDFSIDIKKILANVTSKTRLFFLCSPNNPTANQFKIEEVNSLMQGFPGLVAIDEAYVEFAGYSTAQLIDRFENLVVLRTFSKAFGLAGLRLGYAISNPDLAATLSEKAQLPYPVNSITLRMGLKILENVEIMRKAVTQLKRERKRLIKELNDINGVEAFDSQTNFVTFYTKKESGEIFQALLDQGVLVRNLGRILHFDWCLRATVGLPEMNDKLLAALEQICGE